MGLQKFIKIWEKFNFYVYQRLVGSPVDRVDIWKKYFFNTPMCQITKKHKQREYKGITPGTLYTVGKNVPVTRAGSPLSSPTAASVTARFSRRAMDTLSPGRIPCRDPTRTSRGPT